MKKSMLKCLGIALPLLILLAGCVLPGTGTVSIHNKLSGGREITALYLYLNTDPRGSSIISSPLGPDESESELGVEPGDYTIEADIDFGNETAFDTVTVREGTYHIVLIVDSDIL